MPLIDRARALGAGELLRSCLGSLDGAVILFDGSAAHLLEESGFRPLPAEPAWEEPAREAMATGAPVERRTGEGAVVAACPLRIGAAIAGSLVCVCAGVAPGLLRALVGAAALALGERADRALLDAEHARLLQRAQEARADAEAAQRRLAFLDQASSALFASPFDTRERLVTMAQLAVPDLADWCWTDLLEPEGATVERTAIAHWNPAGAPVAARERGGRHPLERCASARVIRTGEPLLAEGAAEAGGDGALLAELGAKSMLVLPLQARGETFGAMTFLFAESNRRYGTADLRLAQDLAHRASLAVDNARLYEQAERAVRARDDMLAVVSHDLRNPLSAILANAGVLFRKLPPGEDGERIRKRGEAIRRSAERMNHLIRDLLDMARIESRKLQLEPGLHEVGALAGEALEMFQPLAIEGQIALTAEIGDPQLQIECDRERVLQVLSNLLGNAIKFTPRGGSVRLLARREPGHVRFGIADTGPGIAEENLEHIFDRYWQVRASGRAGAGLGLSIARGIVHAHGGRIWAESEPGSGSTFWFTLPR